MNDSPTRAGLAYYNDNDPYAAQWLRNLIASKHIADGVVDGRSIKEVCAVDVAGYRQCHFFGGVGGWSYALRLAGWGDREVWTGSCPCQPFSSAGKRRGTADERHLWPDFLRLISECRPPTIIGEQVSSKDGRKWLAGVRADLEALGYAVGAADLCAASASAPHIRQRLFWVAHTRGAGSRGDGRAVPGAEAPGGREGLELRDFRDFTDQSVADGATGGVADAEHTIGRSLSGHQQDVLDGHDGGWSEAHGEPGARSEVCGVAQSKGKQSHRSRDTRRGRREPADGSRLGDPFGSRLEERSGERRDDEPQRTPAERAGGAVGRLGQPHGSGSQSGFVVGETMGHGSSTVSASDAGFWSDAIWLPCLDGKARRIKQCIQPLAHGLPIAMDGLGPISRVGTLRGAGNAIVSQVAAIFIKAFLDTINQQQE